MKTIKTVLVMVLGLLGFRSFAAPSSAKEALVFEGVRVEEKEFVEAAPGTQDYKVVR